LDFVQPMARRRAVAAPWGETKPGSRGMSLALGFPSGSWGRTAFEGENGGDSAVALMAGSAAEPVLLGSLDEQGGAPDGLRAMLDSGTDVIVLSSRCSKSPAKSIIQ